MAAALARHLLGADAHVESAGIDAGCGDAATKNAVQAMKELGLDISSHQSRSLSVFNLHEFDLLVALTPTIAEVLRDKGADTSKIRTLDIQDPYGRGLDCYMAAAAAIERDLRELFGIGHEERL